MSNAGHESKVPFSGSIGVVFLIGLIVGCVVVFFAVAGRTEGVIQQRRELLLLKKANGENPAVPNESGMPMPTVPSAVSHDVTPPVHETGKPPGQEAR